MNFFSGPQDMKKIIQKKNKIPIMYAIVLETHLVLCRIQGYQSLGPETPHHRDINIGIHNQQRILTLSCSYIY